jgi:hypothetical protein
MDSLIIANITHDKPAKIATAAEEDRYYRSHERRLDLPAVPAASIMAVAGLFLLAIVGLPG